MTLIKWKNSNPLMGTTLSDFFGDFVDIRFPFEGGRSHFPAVNISEDGDKFQLEVSAPGFEKSDFSVNVENEVLVISAESKAEKQENGRNYSRREFSFGSFERSFSLPDNVKTDAIEASYEKGILKVDLPKQDAAKVAPARKIEIS